MSALRWLGDHIFADRRQPRRWTVVAVMAATQTLTSWTIGRTWR